MLSFKYRNVILASLVLSGGGAHAAFVPPNRGLIGRKSLLLPGRAAAAPGTKSPSLSSPTALSTATMPDVDVDVVANGGTAGMLDLSRFPRRTYTPSATPIEFLPTLTRALGGVVNVYVKRDDLLGLTGGGNKTRKLEFVMADAIAKGADTIITCGAVQSNHCRLTLSACIKEGMRCCLVLEERVPGSYREGASGNNYLFNLLGVEKTVTVGLNEAPAAVEKMAEELRAEGRNVYCIPGGASNEIGGTGYVACAEEIMNQVETEEDIPTFDFLVTASGSGGTHAGITAGMVALRSPTKVVGISTRHPEETQRAHIRDLAERVLEHVGMSDSRLPTDAVVVKDEYVGPGYSLPTEGMEEAVTMFARTEGILLDPVYTGKAAAGLVDLVRSGYFPEGSNVLFLHTGGAPSLYHYRPMDRSVPGVAGGGSES